jgi:tetratricopeptide (TPR) repeat protein
MALFGFNKQKVLAAAEKYVQQGKLQNAISEYEKIIKNDAKDLTVTNTIGDLYSRIGESDKATDCFKTVGDAYASQGFTVKAIAMYKKISKLKPSLESLLKLAELYTQQGLFNDARAQYLQVAEEFLKAGELENAVRIFQKILEMDPENSAMRVRLAEVYVRLGKKTEAWEIFSAAAESMRSKGSLSSADEILQRMLTLDPGNTYALLMLGKNQVESADAAGAVVTLLKVGDIDSHPDGLRDLLKAYLLTGQLSEAGAVAHKLLTVHNDPTAISNLADALMQAGQYETALQVYDQHAERLLAENSDKVLTHLHSIIGHVRENPDSLQKLLDLFNKAGETTHVSEVTELLAHASVQAGDLPRARDLYQKLAQIEPQNPLHMQNYQQVVCQLSGTSDVKLITPEEAVVLIDDLEATAPSVHQHYSDEVALAVRSALTDAELFISYNMPGKAMGPLAAVLPMAPNDLRINQRLAALHTRAGRFAEAALCCRTLQSLYSDAGYPEEATRYGELAERYEERSSAPSAVGPAEETPIFLDAPAQSAAPPAVAAEIPVSKPASKAGRVSEAGPEVAAEARAPRPAASAGQAEEITIEAADETEFAVVEGSAAAEPAGAESEIDLSSEWDDSVTVEAEAPEGAQVEAAESSKTEETIEEIRFYLANGMPEQAQAALVKLQALTGDPGILAELRSEVEAAAQRASEEAEVQVETEPVVEDLTASDIPSIEVTAEEPAVAEEPSAAEPSAPPAERHPAAAKPTAAESEPEPVASGAEPAHGVLSEFLSELESSLGADFQPGKMAKAVESPAIPAAHSAPVMGEFVADIEAPVGGEFSKAAAVAEPPAAPAPKAAPAPLPAPARAAKASPAIAASAAASASAQSYSVPAAPPRAPVAWPRPAVEAAKPQAPTVPAPHTPAAPAGAGVSPFGEEAGVDLAEMFGELKQDLEADVVATDDDPETHYNLGIAFREMGLLDESIGELQKACQAFDRGHPFPQIMQTYTWLAQCFLEKGVPEAAVRWYEKALSVPAIDGETRIALSYELAAAYETAGDKPAALRHFMDVYGSNIDYRDVAERIKVLKS